MLKKLAGSAKTRGEICQAQLGDRIESIISDSGPEGWLEWTLDFRNMLVHRGRRLEFGQIVPVKPVLYGADGAPLLRVSRVTHLPRDPGRSDIEVFVDAGWSFVLTEEAEQTLRGLMSSTRVMLESTAAELLGFWEWRRQNPGILRQPIEQWKGGRSTQSTRFDGYAPGTLQLAPDVGIMHPVMVSQLRSAALGDESRNRWALFD